MNNTLMKFNEVMDNIAEFAPGISKDLNIDIDVAIEYLLASLDNKQDYDSVIENIKNNTSLVHRYKKETIEEVRKRIKY